MSRLKLITFILEGRAFRVDTTNCDLYCKNIARSTLIRVILSTEPKPRAPKSKPIEVAAWEEVRPQLAAVLSAGLENYPPPFDAASDVPIDQQKYVSGLILRMCNVHACVYACMRAGVHASCVRTCVHTCLCVCVHASVHITRCFISFPTFHCLNVIGYLLRKPLWPSTANIKIITIDLQLKCKSRLPFWKINFVEDGARAPNLLGEWKYILLIKILSLYNVRGYNFKSPLNKFSLIYKKLSF